MKKFPAAVVLAFLSACAVFAEVPSGPIIIVVQREAPMRPKVNDKVMKFPELVRFLADAAKASKPRQRITIRLQDNKDIAVAASIAQLAGKTHDSIVIEIAVAGDGSLTYILPIAKEGVTIDFDQSKGRRLLPTDPNSNRVIEDQFRQFQNRSTGEMH